MRVYSLSDMSTIGGEDQFCSGFEGELFNREGEAWPEVDITLVDLALGMTEKH